MAEAQLRASQASPHAHALRDCTSSRVNINLTRSFSSPAYCIGPASTSGAEYLRDISTQTANHYTCPLPAPVLPLFDNDDPNFHKIRSISKSKAPPVIVGRGLEGLGVTMVHVPVSVPNMATLQDVDNPRPLLQQRRVASLAQIRTLPNGSPVSRSQQPFNSTLRIPSQRPSTAPSRDSGMARPGVPASFRPLLSSGVPFIESSPLRRSTNYAVGPTLRISHDAHKIIMGLDEYADKGSKSANKLAFSVTPNIRSQLKRLPIATTPSRIPVPTVPTVPRPGSKKREIVQRQNAITFTPRSSSLPTSPGYIPFSNLVIETAAPESNSTTDRIARPTKASEARTQESKSKLAFLRRTKKIAPASRKSVMKPIARSNIPPVSSITAKSLHHRIWSKVSGMGRTQGVSASASLEETQVKGPDTDNVEAESAEARSAEVGAAEITRMTARRTSRNLTTYNNSGMSRRVSEENRVPSNDTAFERLMAQVGDLQSIINDNNVHLARMEAIRRTNYTHLSGTTIGDYIEGENPVERSSSSSAMAHALRDQVPNQYSYDEDYQLDDAFTGGERGDMDPPNRNDGQDIAGSHRVNFRRPRMISRGTQTIQTGTYYNNYGTVGNGDSENEESSTSSPI